VSATATLRALRASGGAAADLAARAVLLRTADPAASRTHRRRAGGPATAPAGLVAVACPGPSAAPVLTSGWLPATAEVVVALASAPVTPRATHDQEEVLHAAASDH
jgi:hypothetical protein